MVKNINLILLIFIKITVCAYAQSYSPVATAPESVSSSIQFFDKSNTPLPLATGKFSIIYGKNNGNSIKRPFIIVEGFDPLTENSFDDLISLYNDREGYGSGKRSLLHELYENNFDVIMLDFGDGADYIQNNAFLLVSLIEEINKRKVTSEENVVLGFSMGGLVARYALTYMEANAKPHGCKLYISHDAPHKGANISMGIQHLIKDWVYHNSGLPGLVLQTTLKRSEYYLPASKQMLVYHYAYTIELLDKLVAQPHYEKILLFKEMYNLSPSSNGYPRELKKIAIANGNEDGLGQTDGTSFLQNGDVIFSFEYNKPHPKQWVEYPFCIDRCCRLISFKGCSMELPADHVSSVARAGFPVNGDPLDELSYLWLLGATGLHIGGEKKSYFMTDNFNYDNLPGSFNPYLEEAKAVLDSKQISSSVYPNLAFVPTFSALDLTGSPWTKFNSATESCRSPFDFIHAEKSNFHHVRLTERARDFVINHCITTASNWNYATAIDFICPERTIENSQSYYKKASGKIETSGSTIIQNNGSATLLAGNSVVLKPGFQCLSGGKLIAKVERIKNSNTCHTSLNFNPHYVVSVPSGYMKDEGKRILEDGDIIYDETNYKSMPNYSEDTLYSWDRKETIDHTSEIQSYLQNAVRIYPNPTRGNLSVTFNSDFPIGLTKLSVYGPSQNLVYYSNSFTTYSQTINLTNHPNGMFLFKFLINDYPYEIKVFKE